MTVLLHKVRPLPTGNPIEMVSLSKRGKVNFIANKASSLRLRNTHGVEVMIQDTRQNQVSKKRPLSKTAEYIISLKHILYRRGYAA
jgi:hypothetical protein